MFKERHNLLDVVVKVEEKKISIYIKIPVTLKHFIQNTQIKKIATINHFDCKGLHVRCLEEIQIKCNGKKHMKENDVKLVAT